MTWSHAVQRIDLHLCDGTWRRVVLGERVVEHDHEHRGGGIKPIIEAHYRDGGRAFDVIGRSKDRYKIDRIRWTKASGNDDPDEYEVTECAVSIAGSRCEDDVSVLVFRLEGKRSFNLVPANHKLPTEPWVGHGERPRTDKAWVAPLFRGKR